MAKGEGQGNQEKILETLGDFTDKENWDKFFTIRGSDDAFEWYAEWPQLRSLLMENLSFPAKTPKEVSFLVPGCGNSRLSEHLYDAGFQSITNIDFSKVVIMNMLRRNVRERPEMKWRVMDMTELQFNDESFDAVLDKGGLDTLMEPKLGLRLGNVYLREVKRVLKTGGKFICLTLAESHVLDLLFPKFRFGWKMSFHAIAQPQGPLYGTPKLQTFVIVAEKDSPTAVSDISLFLGEYSVEPYGDQARKLYETLSKERKIRTEYSNESDLSYSIEDLRFGAKGNISLFQPGRRIKLILGEPGVSNFFYNGVLLDAKEDSGNFSFHYSVFIVPKIRAHDWLYTSEAGQWLILSGSKSARLCMVLLDSSNSIFSIDSIQSDLSPLIQQLAPGYGEIALQIPVLLAGDGIRKRDIVHQVESDLTGLITVEDLIYEDIKNNNKPCKGHKHRLLTFQRTQNLVQSEALLSTKFDSCSSTSPAESGEMEVNHNHLASPYHHGIISGILLISAHLNIATTLEDLVKTVILGLGGGLLPMFMKINLPTLKIEVVELDPVVVDVAKECFGLEEDERLKIHITDGIKFVKEIADSKVEAEEVSFCKIDILVVDVDSSDTSSGLTLPEAEFVEESFLLAAKESLSEQGLFIVNLVSRSSTVKDAVYSRLKNVFSNNIFRLKIEEDVNEVLFVLKTDSAIGEEQLMEARDVVATYSEKVKAEWCEKIVHLSKSIELLS